MCRNRQKEKTPDASGHMTAAPGVCCYLFLSVMELLVVIVGIRHTFQLGKDLAQIVMVLWQMLSQIRRKIGDGYIKTVIGCGYKFEV